MTWDVAVIGLGAMGSAAACHLARRGKRVIGLERFWPGHDRGSSHGRTRITRVAYFEHPDYVPLLKRAHELWRDLELETGRDLLIETGGLMIGPRESAVVSGALESARRHGLRHRLLEGAELARAYPQFRFRPEDVALHEEDAGVLLPEECVRAHHELALRAGAELRFGAPASFVVDPRETTGPVEIEANGQRILAEKVVVTAGAWMSSVLPKGSGPRLNVERNVVFWFEPLRDPGAFAPPRLPIWIWDYPGHVSYGIPAVKGDAPKVAFHHMREPTDPDHLRRSVSMEEVETMRVRLAKAIPDLNGRLVAASACLYTNTEDEHFAIGPIAGGRVIIASACSGHGFKMSSVVGEVLADLAADGRTRHPIGFLSLEREGLKPSV